jgi:hypothetical protein
MLQELVDSDPDQGHGPELRNFAEFHQVQFIQQKHGPDKHQDGAKQDLGTDSIVSVVRHFQISLQLKVIIGGKAGQRFFGE